MIKALQKLKGRSVAELRTRGRQAAHVWAERRGWSARDGGLASDAEFFALLDGLSVRDTDGLLAHFRARTAPRFFAGFADPQETRAELARQFGGRAAAAVVARAERVCQGKFDLLGMRGLDFGRPVDWRLEPLSGKKSPLVHWSRIDYLNAEVAGDKKIVWELNRQQHFMTLGRAYWHTGDERYAQVFAAHADTWLDANPPKLGINWVSSLELAFRAVSWLWALYFFKDSPSLTPALFLRLAKSLVLHAWHLESYLSTYFSPNTHLTGEALGLYYLGTLLSGCRDAARWRDTGRRILLAQLDRQIRPDGVYFEQSTYYHRYTTDFYLHLYLLAEANQDEAVLGDDRLRGKLTALLDHLLYVTRPDGTTPFFGDDDGGRLVQLDERPCADFRATLMTGAALFARADYKYVAGEPTEEVLWLTGARGWRSLAALAPAPPAQTSRAFPDGGYYVMRDGWMADANYMLLDAGPHGAPALNYGHAHADALAFDLAAHGRTLLVDPGTYTYTGASEWRDHFRTTQAHNTLTVDGASSSVPASPFRWQHIANASARTWLTTPRFDYLVAEHDGYLRLAPPARHERGVLFLKRDYWIVRDRVATTGQHRCDLTFQFAPDAAPVLSDKDDCVREASLGAAGLELYTFAPGGAWRREEGYVSPAYGARMPAPVYKFSAAAKGAQEFITLLVPSHLKQAAHAAREIAAVGGRAFALQGHAARAVRDVLLVGDGRVVEADRFASDFAWAWVRFNDEEDAPVEMVLLDGRCLRFDGSVLVQAARRVGYVAARRAGGEWSVETDGDCAVSVEAVESSSYVRN